LNPGIHHNWTQELELIQRANRLWEELAEEQPANLDFMQKVRMSRSRMMSAMLSRPARDSCLRLAQDTKGQLVKLVQKEPSNRVLRKQLALTCFVLGEICSWKPPVAQPSSFWRDAHDHYKILAEAQGDDILVKMSLATSCRPLIRGQSSDPYYIEAVRMLEQAGKSLTALLKQNPTQEWLRDALLEDYCELALCHSKVGRSANAAKIVNDDIQPFVTTFTKQQADPAHGLALLRTLSKASSALWEGKQPAAALAIARQGAALTLKYAANSLRDPGFLDQLGYASIDFSAILNQLGDARLSLQMAELARDAYEEAGRATPDGIGFDNSLQNVWTRIGKAHWSLGARDKALGAFRESAAIQKRIFEREPSNHASRATLNSCYDRLVYFGSLGGDLPSAVAALLEREKLWSDDVANLTRIADDFKRLADWIDVRAKGQLSPQQQAEKSRYLAESKRIRDAAKRKGVAGAPTAIGDRR
jgi:tetratricopeptide (TPR) repeat protein